MFYGSVIKLFISESLYIIEGVNLQRYYCSTAIRHNKTAQIAEAGLTERLIFSILKSPNTYQAVR